MGAAGTTVAGTMSGAIRRKSAKRAGAEMLQHSPNRPYRAP